MEAMLLKPEEAGRALGVSRTVIFELLRRGELPSVTIGRSRRITPDAIRHYVQLLHERQAGEREA